MLLYYVRLARMIVLVGMCLLVAPTAYASQEPLINRPEANFTVSVSISGVPSQFSLNLYVDGSQQGTISGSQTRQLNLTQGTHTITTDATINGALGTQYTTLDTGFKTTQAGSHTFAYDTYYQFAMKLSTVSGKATEIFALSSSTNCCSRTNWLKAGSQTATPTAPAKVTGMGSQFVFQYWAINGQRVTTNPVKVVMNQSVTAVAWYQI